MGNISEKIARGKEIELESFRKLQKVSGMISWIVLGYLIVSDIYLFYTWNNKKSSYCKGVSEVNDKRCRQFSEQAICFNGGNMGGNICTWCENCPVPASEKSYIMSNLVINTIVSLIIWGVFGSLNMFKV